MRESARNEVVYGVQDSTLSARILTRRPLLYESGASPALDRPAHVRAASGVSWLGEKLAIIQDDASFLALVDPHGAGVQAVALPAGKDGLRQFDKARGNKRDKPDYEACFVVADTLIALGSGSRLQRERIVSIVRGELGWAVRERDGARFYAALRAAREFAGSELNIEGALVIGERLRLFQRGNGAERAGVLPSNATCELSLAAFIAYLDEPEGPAPGLERITRFELGCVSSVPLTFTDAALHPTAQVVFLASAEASPDTVRDGEVMGTAVGVMDSERGARWTLLRDEAGALSRDKAEGIAIDPALPERAYIVVDPDDHARPAELLTVALSLG